MRLSIHRDGRLVIHEHGELERELEKSDPLALATAFRAVVELENELTCAQLFRALAPWANLLSRAAWIDFETWLGSASRTPLRLVRADTATQSDDEPPLDAVIVHPVLSVLRDHPRNLSPATLNICWRTSGRYASPRPDGFGGEDRFCSLSLSPPEEWAHLPLIIDTSMMVDDVDSFRRDVASLQAVVDEKLRAEPTLFETIILGFLDDISFHGTPAEAVETRDELLARLDEARAQAEKDSP